MKCSRWCCVAVLAAMVVQAAAFGQAVEVQPNVIQLQPRVVADQPLLAPAGLQRLKLTDEQKTKFDKIDADYKEKAQAEQAKYKEAIKALRDREQFKEAQDKLKAEVTKLRDASLAKVEPILTDEQKAIFTQVKVLPNPGGVIVRPPLGGTGINPVLPPATQNRLQLTDEQKKQIADIQKDVEAKIMKVLTDEQKKQLEQMKKGPIIRPVPIQPNPRIQIQPLSPNVLPNIRKPVDE